MIVRGAIQALRVLLHLLRRSQNTYLQANSFAKQILNNRTSMYHCITTRAVLNNDPFSIESVDDFFKKGEISITIKRLSEEHRYCLTFENTRKAQRK